MGGRADLAVLSPKARQAMHADRPADSGRARAAQAWNALGGCPMAALNMALNALSLL